MRLVLDTNVVASGLLWNGAPARLLDAAQTGELELFTSTRLLAELAGILTRVKFAKALAAAGLPREELVLGNAESATVIAPAAIPPTRRVEAHEATPRPVAAVFAFGLWEPENGDCSVGRHLTPLSLGQRVPWA